MECGVVRFCWVNQRDGVWCGVMRSRREKTRGIFKKSTITGAHHWRHDCSEECLQLTGGEGMVCEATKELRGCIHVVAVVE